MADPIAELLARPRVFSLPTLHSNEQGWGPSEGPAEFQDVPFAPFQKSDKLGRVSDWISGRFYPNTRTKAFGQGTGAFGYTQEFEESSFALVDNTPRFKPRDGRRRYAKFSIHNKRRRGRGFNKRYPDGGRGRGGAGRGTGAARGGTNRQQAANRWGAKRWGQQAPEAKLPSITVQESWRLVSTTELAELNKFAMRAPVGTNVVTAGKIERYNAQRFDQVTPRNPPPLQRFENVEWITATTSEDPILLRLKEEGHGTVYGTDTILACLMSAGRSVQTWDVIANKVNGVITLDKRANSSLDYLTVNENWNEVQETDIKSFNHPTNLFKEATMINHNFSQQVLESKGEPVVLDEENPFNSNQFENGEQPASVGYRYRSWRLSEDITVVGRCEVNAYDIRNGEKVFLSVQALHELDHQLSGGMDWKSKLELQPAQVLAAEMKNNNCKLAKFAAKMELAGTDELRLGFVSRKSTFGGDLQHEVLLVRKFQPETFVHQLQMQKANLWASLKRILEDIMEQPDGQYLLLKDANEPKLHLYSVPDGPIEDSSEHAS